MNDCELLGHSVMDKRPTLNYYIRLESESSLGSEEDTESINSIQDRETEFAQDTADTDSDSSSCFEYEVASLSETEDPANYNSSSGSDDLFVTQAVIAAVLGDTSLEAWAPDGEDSYSSTDSEEFNKTDFWTCAQCKSKNNNPQFRLCGKCFQVRKNFYPPRPKRSKKQKTESNKAAVNVDNLQSCLSGLSQDSGVGSSQEFPVLDFKEIKVPEQHLNKCSSSSSGISSEGSSASSNSERTSDDLQCIGAATNRKRKFSETISDNDVRPKKIILEGPLLNKNESTHNNTADIVESNTELKELCIICTIKKKDGIFLHGSSAHACCCYGCAIKTWKTNKRCPVCNRRVSNVVKLFSM